MLPEDDDLMDVTRSAGVFCVEEYHHGDRQDKWGEIITMEALQSVVSHPPQYSAVPPFST